MKKYLIIIALCLLGATAEAQTSTGDTTIYTKVDKNANFPGGISAFYKYLAEGIYYNYAIGNKKEGKVFITFVVEKDGSLTGHKILRGISEEADNEVVRVMKASPKWEPAKIGDNHVRQQYTVPVNFVNPLNQSLASVDTTTYTKVDKIASFPGGMPNFYKYLSDNISMPKDANGERIKGTVYVRFVVEKDGSLTNLIVWKSLNPEADAEALGVFKKMPKWEPATINDKIVRQLYTVPINFKQ